MSCVAERNTMAAYADLVVCKMPGGDRDAHIDLFGAA
jgi:hypothetical protein